MVFIKGDIKTKLAGRRGGKASSGNFKNMSRKDLKKFNSEMGKRSAEARRKRKEAECSNE